MQTGSINFAAKVAKQQRSHRTIDQITEDRGHRQRPEMGANHRKSETRQHRAGFDHADFVELQLFLHQRAELLPVGDHHKRQRQCFNQRCQVRVIQHVADEITQQKHRHAHHDPQPDVQPVQRGEFKVTDFFSLNNRVSDTEVRKRICQRDNHQRHSQQAELVVVDNPRQHGHLHQPEADDDHRGNRRPLRAADGFFT